SALGRLAANVESLYPWPVLVLAAAGAVQVVRDRRWIVIGLCMVGITHIVLFPAGAVMHDYWGFALLPGVSLCAATGALVISGLVLRRPPAASFGLAIALMLPGLYLSSRRCDRLFAITTDGLREYRLGCLLRDHCSVTERILTNGPYNPYD